MDILIKFQVFILIFSASAFADICEIETPYLVQRAQISDTPNYFFRTFPDSNIVSYANSSSENKTLNLDTGKKVKVPGRYDPVPTWDEEIITVPDGSMEFYSYKDLSQGKRKAILIDDKLSGVYQSIGNISKDKIRVITDSSGLSYRDYSIKKTGSVVDIKPSGKVKQPCSDRDIKLPMISKDGKFLAARDMNLNPPTTKIFELTEDDKCKLIKDLGVHTGKVDFSFDGKKLVYHQSTSSTEGARYFDTPSSVQDVFVYDLETNDVKKITNNSDGKTSYYPVWKRNNNIVYIDKDTDSNFSFVVANPSKFSVDGKTGTLSEGLSCGEKTKSGLEALGEIWKGICLQTSGLSPDSKSSLLTALSLSYQKCKELVDDHWDKLKANIDDRLSKGTISESISRRELLAACPKSKVSKISPGKKIKEKVRTPKEIIGVKCNSCHGDITSKLSELTNSISSKSKSWKDEIVNRINSSDGSYKMPMGSDMSDTEKKSVIDYIKSFKGE